MDSSPYIREYRCTTGGHFKRWAVSGPHNKPGVGWYVDVSWGRIGSAGQDQTKHFSSVFAAMAFITRMISEKKDKGYKFHRETKLIEAPPLGVAKPQPAQAAPPTVAPAWSAAPVAVVGEAWSPNDDTASCIGPGGAQRVFIKGQRVRLLRHGGGTPLDVMRNVIYFDKIGVETRISGFAPETFTDADGVRRITVCALLDEPGTPLWRIAFLEDAPEIEVKPPAIPHQSDLDFLDALGF